MEGCFEKAEPLCPKTKLKNLLKKVSGVTRHSRNSLITGHAGTHNERQPAITFDEMKEFMLNQNVAKFKIPERLEVKDQFPMTQTGKVRKFQLREEVAQKLLEDKVITDDDFNVFIKKK